MPTEAEIIKSIRAKKPAAGGRVRTASGGDRRTEKELQQLANSVQRQSKQTERITGKPGTKPKESTLGRVFDILQRGNYMTAEAVGRIAEGKGPVDVLKGAAGGLAGKNKTSYTQLINKLGIKGPIGAGLGLAGDIFLDPGTYMGGVLVTGPSKVAKAAKAGRVAVEAIEQTGNIQKIADAGKAIKTAKEEAAAAIEAVAGKSTAAGAKTDVKIAREAARTAQIEATGREAVEKAFADTPKDALGYIGLRIGNKHVIKLHKPYKGLAAVGGMLGKTTLGKALNEGFRTGAKLPGKMKTTMGMHKAIGVAEGQRQIREIYKLGKDLTVEEKRMIGRGLEGPPLSDPKLEAIRQEAINILGIVDEREIAAGLRTKSADNYAYHYYRNFDNPQRAKFKSGRNAHEGSINIEKWGLEAAERAGLDPVLEFDEMLARRVFKSHSKVNHASGVNAIFKEYGVEASRKYSRTYLEKQGFQRMENPYQKGEFLWLNENAREAIKFLQKAQRDPREAHKLTRLFDKVQGQMKFGLTAVNPGHHVRNLMGDIYLNFLDGVNDPRVYGRAMAVLKDAGKSGKEFTVGGQKFTADKLIEGFEKGGGKSGFFREEMGKVGGESTTGRIAKGEEWIRDKAEMRENWTRFTHYLDALDKSLKKQTKKSGKNITTTSDPIFKQASIEAAARVRKWNIDYGDLTDFETRIAKRAIPFYTFMRKNMPLQFEALMMRPGRVAVVPKATDAISKLSQQSGIPGISEGGQTVDPDELPDFATMPKWMQEASKVTLTGEGEGKNAVYWLPGLPIDDIQKYFGGFSEGKGKGRLAAGAKEFSKEIVSGSTPFVKIPFEQATGHSTFNQAPIKNDADYFAEQMPLLRLANRALSGAKEGKDKGIGGKELRRDEIIRYLTGLGVREVTPGMRKGELRRQEDILQTILRKEKAKRKEERRNQ